MVVVDTSVVYKWYDEEEEYHLQALKISDAHVKKQELVVIPDLLLYEIANAWSTKTHLTHSRINKNLLNLKKINLRVEPITFDLVWKIVTLSRKFHVSVYDATYAVLAKEKRCNLITADNKFADKVKLRFVKKLGEFVQSF